MWHPGNAPKGLHPARVTGAALHIPESESEVEFRAIRVQGSPSLEINKAVAVSLLHEIIELRAHVPKLRILM